jgi:DNA-binding NarL/FixJ family response regulator
VSIDCQDTSLSIEILDNGNGRASAVQTGYGLPSRALANITDREREVLTLVGSGLSNTKIATQLYISVATTKTYVTPLLAKLGTCDRVHLVIIAYETGLVAPAQ